LQDFALADFVAAPKPTSLSNLGLCSAVGTVDSVCKTGNEIEMNKLKLKQTVSRGLGKPTIEGERHTRQSARVFPAFKDRGTNGTTSVAEGPSSRFWQRESSGYLALRELLDMFPDVFFL